MRSLLLCLLASLSVPAFQNATTWTSGYDGIHSGGGLGSMDRLFDVRPYGKDSILVVGVRPDSTYCQPGIKYLFGYQPAKACIVDNTVEMWDRSGNVLWKRFQKIEEPSYWFTSTTLANGDILTAGIATVDTLNYDTSSKAMNQAVRTARISRWNRSGEMLWTWRLTSKPASTASSFGPRLEVGWMDTLANGDIVFLGRTTYDALLLPGNDTVDLAPAFAKVRGFYSEAGFVGCLSSQAQLRWIKPVSLLAKSYGLRDGLSALIRGNEILVARSVPQDTLGTTNVILSRYDASGNLLSESSPLGSAPAAVNGIAKSEDGSLFLSISPDSNAVQIAGKTVAIPSDSAFLRSSTVPTTGRNLLLLLDSSLNPLLAKPLSGFRRPGSWNVGRAPGHGWLAWGEDWNGYNDTAFLIRLDDSLRIQETSSQLNGVRSVHASGNELWLSGSVQGATKTGNGGTMMASRMEFDPPKAVRLLQTSSRTPLLWQKGCRIGWSGSAPARLSISNASGQREAEVTLLPGDALPLSSGLHLIQVQSQDIKQSRVIAIP